MHTEKASYGERELCCSSTLPTAPEKGVCSGIGKEESNEKRRVTPGVKGISELFRLSHLEAKRGGWGGFPVVLTWQSSMFQHTVTGEGGKWKLEHMAGAV